MATTALNTTINDLRDQARTVHANLTASVEATRADSALSAYGKQQQIAKTYLSARQTLRELEQRERTEIAKARGELERRVFGQIATDAQSLMAYRDAQDRAARLTVNDKAHATSLLRTAHLSGDDVLAAAIIGQAINHGWADLVTSHTERNPHTGEALKDLSDIAQFENDTRTEMQRMFDYADNRPRELDRLQERALNDVAEGTPPAA